MTETVKTSYPTLIVVFVIAFLLGYGTSARIVNRRESGTEQKAAQGSGEEEMRESGIAQISAAISTGINAVSANDQPAGNTVSVVVKAEKDIWVAVHEDTGGKPGSILGAQLFAKGTSTGAVDLLRRLMAGRKYYVMLHADDGDRLLDLAKDTPIIGSDGSVIMDAFTAQDAAPTQ
ncbi:MAG: hypothetical protein AAB533_01670 [Patescibacteria group bacterium]